MNPFEYIKKYHHFFISFLYLFWSTGCLTAQENPDSTNLYYLETQDGNIYIAEVLSESRRNMQIKTDYLGVISVEKRYLSYIEPYDESRIINDVYWVKNKIPGKYMLTPTGSLQEARRGFYENRYIIISHFNIAIDDYFSLGIGVIPLFLVTDASVPVWIVPKVKLSGPEKDFNLSVGTFLGRTVFGDSDFDDARIALPFMAASYGNEHFNLSGGIGMGTLDGEWMSSPAFTFSGSMRLGKRSFIFMENIMVNTFNRERYEDQTIIFSLGGRIMRKRAVWDFGIFTPRVYEDDPIRIIPYFGFYLPFKSKKND